MRGEIEMNIGHGGWGQMEAGARLGVAGGGARWEHGPDGGA